MFEKSGDYDLTVLRLVAQLSNGAGSVNEVFDLFYATYASQLPKGALKPINSNSNEPQWQKRVRWSHEYLIEMNLLEESTQGLWQITDEGKEWLARNPTATSISEVTRMRTVGDVSKAGQKPHSDQKVPQPLNDIPAGITFKMLEQTRQAMPPDQFRRVWGLLTQVTDEELLLVAKRLVRRIQSFLQGRFNDTPKSKEVCDWIQLCYILGMYREGAALWQYVDREEVNPGHYERVKKISASCRTKRGF
jgi:hypothetical protein